jgi:glycosyltransferase involved in cell wall biosynthesis
MAENKGGDMVSIIIVTRNNKIPEINQTYKDIEVIVQSKGDIRTARQEGIKQSKGEYICFIDDDQVLPSHLLEECVKDCENGHDGVTWIERGYNANTFCELVIDYDKKLFHEAFDDDPIRGAAEPRFFKSEFVKRLDFDKLPPVTFELAGINKQIVGMGADIYFSFVTVYHHEPKTFRDLFSKFFRYGYYYFPALKLDPELVLNHSKPRRVYFKWEAFTDHPLLYVGLWYHYFIKATAALGGALWYLIRGL